MVKAVRPICEKSTMTEFLIYNTDHWMDALTEVEVAEYENRYPNFRSKYNARYQRGDIVEVREDGFWGDGPYPRKDVFRVVRVPGMSLKDAQVYHVSLEKVEFDLDDGGGIQYDENNDIIVKTTLLKRCKYCVDSGMGVDVATVAVKDLQITDKTVAVIG